MQIMKSIKNYIIMTFSTIIMAIGIYYFKFPNNFTFGGVTGLAVVVAKVTRLSASQFTFIINMLLLIIGLIFLGKEFAVKTAYTSILLSVSLSLLEYIHPITTPLTNEPMLELIFAVALPATSAAMLFNIGASSGGTDVIAMLLKKYTSFDIGISLLITDLIIILAAFFVFDIKTGLYSLVGLSVKSLIVDSVIESINLSKYFNVICEKPDEICEYIVGQLKRSATVCLAKGAFTNREKYMVFTVLNRQQAVQLREHIKVVDSGAFILITNTSEIIGKGFHTP